MSRRSRLARLEAMQRGTAGQRMFIVPFAFGESKTAALHAARIVPEPGDLLILITHYGGGPLGRTPTTTSLEARS
jgi:hypothetical protein